MMKKSQLKVLQRGTGTETEKETKENGLEQTKKNDKAELIETQNNHRSTTDGAVGLQKIS